MSKTREQKHQSIEPEAQPKTLAQMRVEYDRLHEVWNEAERRESALREQVNAGNVSPEDAPRVQAEMATADAERRQASRMADELARRMQPLEEEENRAEAAAAVAAADPAPVCRLCLECDRQIVANERQNTELREKARRAIEAQHNAARAACNVARSHRLPAPTIPLVPKDQLDLARLLVEPPQDWVQVARNLLARVSPGSQLGDLDAEAFVRLFVEAGAEAAHAVVRAREAEVEAQRREALAQATEAKREMRARVDALTDLSRRRALNLAEREELDRLSLWSTKPDGIALWLAERAAERPVPRTVAELEGAPRTVHGLTTEEAKKKAS